MKHDERTEQFIQLLTGQQRGLFSYLVAVLGDVHESHNVLQETNLVLWRRSAEFVEGTDFAAWSRKVAHYKVLSYLRDKKRDRHLFDARLLSQLSEQPWGEEDDDERRVALRECLAALPDRLREVVSLRYGPGGSLRALVDRLGKSEGSVKMTLMRIRGQLMRCVEQKLATEEPT
jgi:RNA polymerase sigma-70 factor (ECF subfamily)